MGLCGVRNAQVESAAKDDLEKPLFHQLLCVVFRVKERGCPEPPRSALVDPHCAYLVGSVVIPLLVGKLGLLYSTFDLKKFGEVVLEIVVRKGKVTCSNDTLKG